ncbi:MAG: sigma-70 family RNA polymerase sigma factor [Firmicutes bacterium]|nr:sigma-70 family RNA polymerase sigma factor [Bacillota bacterium]HXL04409.1 sigma-70 family RNA polymerase sigma factor [Bacillota bacterium]
MSATNQDLDLELLWRARQGQEPAKDDLVRKYLPMVRHIVQTTAVGVPGLEFEDLTQEGLFGLVEAIRQYDVERPGVKFSSFAYLCIIRKVYNSLRRHSSGKHKPLNQALSLYAVMDGENCRPILDLVAGDSLNPETVLEDKWMDMQVEQVLRDYLSVLEYVVTVLLRQGYTTSEISRAIGLNLKAVDNARTRVKGKLRRILGKYGSLTHPEIPRRIRKREDLYLKINVSL